MHQIISLYFTFFKIGLFSFGGGYAMIPLLRQEVTIINNWLTAKEFVEIVAISNITPGPVAINMATFVGYKAAGLLGALATTIGVATPSIIIVLIVSKILAKFNTNKYVKGFLYTLKPAVVGLIISAALQIARLEIMPEQAINIKPLVIAIISLILLTKTKISAIYLIIGAAIISMFFL